MVHAFVRPDGWPGSHAFFPAVVCVVPQKKTKKYIYIYIYSLYCIYAKHTQYIHKTTQTHQYVYNKTHKRTQTHKKTTKT